jgi:hypothetical protein
LVGPDCLGNLFSRLPSRMERKVTQERSDSAGGERFDCTRGHAHLQPAQQLNSHPQSSLPNRYFRFILARF